ncbi:hypothetical protein PG990_005040 [Apiospora arundinis]|uniref:VPS37 C-terminal domain-containing protein n=1 Tax=Apiospora arundinis TaxID=335852 RepID=A0ABR2J6C5_9PEZI
MYSPTPPPPIPPPKPGSHDTSRLGTPATNQSPRPPPNPDSMLDGKGRSFTTDSAGLIPAARQIPPPEEIPDPGEQWLPRFLEDKSKQDLADILSDPNLLNALTHAPDAGHPSLLSSHAGLQSALTENMTLAAHLVDLEGRVSQQRAHTQAQLLSTHALERQWRQKQAEMDAALSSFAPAALYGRLTQALAEQEQICDALEESFLDGGRGAPPPSSLSYNAAADGDDAGGVATEREVLDWVRRYREARKLYYLRQERKERWNERRVGGWR